MGIELRPVKRDDAFPFIKAHHRHHNVPTGYIWCHGVQDDDGALVGVAVCGRPVARELDDGLTTELTRMATDGHPNACSMMYGAWRRAGGTKGYRRGLTYILASEGGASLQASGLRPLWIVKGRSWDCPSRPRTDKHPTEDKVAWGWGSWPEPTPEMKTRLIAMYGEFWVTGKKPSNPTTPGLSGPQGTEAALSATDEPLLLASQNKDADHG